MRICKRNPSGFILWYLHYSPFSYALYSSCKKWKKKTYKKENSNLFVFVFSLRGFLHCHMSIALCVLTILLILLLLLVSTNSLALHVNFRHPWYSCLHCTCSCGASQTQVNVMVLFSRHSHHSGFHLGLFRLPASLYSVVNRTVCQCPCSCLLPGIVEKVSLTFLYPHRLFI